MAIINKLVFIVKNDMGWYVDPPSYKLTANNINRDFIYLISPVDPSTSITATFKADLQGHRGETASFKLSDIPVGELVDLDKPMYKNIEDWNVWLALIPSKALSFISHNRAGRIGMSFQFTQSIARSLPDGVSYGGEITSENEIDNIENGWGYIIKGTNFVSVDGLVANFNDLVYRINDELYKISAIKTSTNTGTVSYSVDPSVYDVDYEEVDYNLTEELLQMVNEAYGIGMANSETLSNFINFANQEFSDIEEHLNKKANKITQEQKDSLGIVYPEERIVYGVDYNLNEMPIKASIFKEKNTIVMRDGGGEFQDLVEHDTNPTAHSDEFNKKVDKITLENANMFKDVNYNNVNGVLTFTRYDDTTKEIDLPLELLVESGYYDEVANELALVLANGSEIRIPVGNLLTDLDAHNIRFSGSGTNYLVNKNDVESAVKELDTRVKANAENVLLSTENDWDLETIFTEKFENSRNGWVQVDNEIYVFGGASFLGGGKDPLFSQEFAKKSYKYNIITKQWTELAQREYNYNEERAVYKDGFIYLFGAANPSGIDGVTSEAYSIHVCQKYEIATNTFTMLADAPFRIVYTSGAVLVDNKIYVFVDSYSTFNGLETPISITNTNTVPFVYDIATNTWEVKTPTNIRFDRGYATYYDGLIYVQRSSKFQAYNPTTDTWITDLTPPTYGLVHTGVMQEFRGRLFIGSGWETAKSKKNPFIQYYDVAEDKWFVATRLEFKNHALGYGSMFLYDNKLYYIGGYSSHAEPNFNNVIRSFDLEKLQFEELDYQRQLIQNNEDSTAKLAESNVFTQPQQVPNATLPQHATNLSQVETMFEMFKRELRGYNLAMPDLEDKEYLGDGVYRIYDNRGITVDYNVYNGIYVINGSFVDSLSIILATNIVEVGSIYTGSIYRISGSAYANYRPLFYLGDVIKDGNFIEYNKDSNTMISTGTNITIYLGGDGSYDNLTFKLQLEKGDTATPYTLPGQIPQYKIVGEE